MARMCERPGCAAPAGVAYGFDPAQRIVWLQAVATEQDGGALCRRHADAMVVPRGWWLDDRRDEPPRLFSPAAELPPTPSRRPRAGRTRRPSPDAPQPASLLDDAVPAAPADDDMTAAWSPIAVARTELADVLDATTPLLARAFGGTRRAPPGRTATG